LVYDKADSSKVLFRTPPESDWGQPVIAINGSVVPPPYDFYNNTLQANVPDAYVKNGGGLLKVSYPFLPERWTATYPISDMASDFKITRLGGKSILISTTNFLGFTKDPNSPTLTPASKKFCWQLIAGDGKPIDLKTDYCDSEAPTRSLSTHSELVTLTEIPDRVALVAPNGAVLLLDIPKSESAAGAAPKPVQLNQYDSLWIDVPAKDAAKVASVEANQLLLKFRIPAADDDGNPPKSIKVQITRDLTSQPGDVELTLLDKDSKPITSTRLHITAARRRGENK
jgi:hypothetical protein